MGPALQWLILYIWSHIQTTKYWTRAVYLVRTMHCSNMWCDLGNSVFSIIKAINLPFSRTIIFFSWHQHLKLQIINNNEKYMNFKIMLLIFAKLLCVICGRVSQIAIVIKERVGFEFCKLISGLWLQYRTCHCSWFWRVTTFLMGKK